MPKPRDLKSENIGSIPQRSASAILNLHEPIENKLFLDRTRKDSNFKRPHIYATLFQIEKCWVGILKGAQVAGFFGHRDDPGFSRARIVDDADVGSRPPVGKLDVFQVVDPVPGALSGGRLVGAVKHDEIALQPQ